MDKEQKPHLTAPLETIVGHHCTVDNTWQTFHFFPVTLHLASRWHCMETLEMQLQELHAV